ncbi:MAG TPA: DUF1501 domain-containing protein [Rhizomicrobium sp.]|nr:DUF1501 domain-containing protein [Rhizomicrobium sp.]
MTQDNAFSRRAALKLGASLGVTFLASPALGAAEAKRKLVVIICRGAMDGLSVSPPIGDANYYALRGPIAIPADAALKLDGDFALHPKLAGIYALTQAGQARIAPAVAIPERIRSHFEAQDLLESGGDHLYATTTGWLNRALSVQSGGVTALAVGAQEPLILRGPSPIQSWSPGGKVTQDMARISTVLQDLYASDPMLSRAFASGMQTEAMAETFSGDGTMNAPVQPQRAAHDYAVTTAKFLTQAGGPSIAVLSLDGYDTHAGQGAVNGQLANHLRNLDDVVNGLHDGLGDSWSNTAIIAVTEFGRTAHINGTGGTDHGTASTMILAGGALRRGGIIGDWPTLADTKLFENRDLAPTLDVRQVFKGVLRDHMGLEARALDETVFPGSSAAPALNGLIA